MLKLWCNLPKVQKYWSRGTQPVLFSSCPVLSCHCHDLSCLKLAEPSIDQLGSACTNLLSTELFVFLDEMTVSVGLVGILTWRSQHVSLSSLAPRLARKLPVGSINAQKLSAQERLGLAVACTIHSVEKGYWLSNDGFFAPFKIYNEFLDRLNKKNSFETFQG